MLILLSIFLKHFSTRPFWLCSCLWCPHNFMPLQDNIFLPSLRVQCYLVAQSGHFGSHCICNNDAFILYYFDLMVWGPLVPPPLPFEGFFFVVFFWKYIAWGVRGKKFAQKKLHFNELWPLKGPQMQFLIVLHIFTCPFPIKVPNRLFKFSLVNLMIRNFIFFYDENYNSQFINKKKDII